jgi:hypothetical protein
LKSPTIRRAFLALSVAGMVLFPANAFGVHNQDDPEYSGTADSTGALVQTTDPVTGEVVTGTVAENTVSANSEGGIIPDQPGTPQNEANDTTVATATPVRVETSDGTRANPDSIAAVAPWDAEGSSATGVVTVGDGNGNVAASSEGSWSHVDAHASSNESTVRTDSQTIGRDTTAGSGDARTVLPNVDSFSFVDRYPNGTIAAGASNVAWRDGAQTVSMLGGYIEIDDVYASSYSQANGHASRNDIEFEVNGLALNDSPFGNPLIWIENANNYVNEMWTDVDATIAGVTGSLQILTGSDLLDRNTWAGHAGLLAAYLSILPQLNNLTGIGGDLEGLSLVLGGGWSDDGNGDYARGMSQAVRAHAWVGGDWETTSVVGYAYSGVDAVRPWSTATDPHYPAGWTPVVDAEAAFPATRAAFPVDWVFAAGPDEVDTVVLGVNELPRTGLEIGALMLFGLLLVAGGFGARRFSRAAA